MTTATTKADDGGMAFPGDEYIKHVGGEPVYAKAPGMSLRDYFAGQVMAGHATKTLLDWQEADEYAYHIADAMLAARKAGPQ